MKQLLLKCTVRCIVIMLFLIRGTFVFSQTVPDSTYGSGGSKTTSTTKYKDGSNEVKIIIKDKNGIVREEKTTTVDKQKEEKENIDYFDTNGKKTRNKKVHKDITGKETYSLDENYKDGIIVSGEITEDINGEKVEKTYNPSTEKYEPKKGKEPAPDNFNFPDFKNEITAAFSIINEDSYQRFNTYGGNVIYTHHVSTHLGISADAGIYFGSNNNFDYTKFQFFVGATFLNVHHSSIMLSPHLLLGIVHLKTKYSMFSSSATALGAIAGFDVIHNLNNKTGIIIKADYNPTFFSNDVQHNFRLSTGLVLRLGN